MREWLHGAIVTLFSHCLIIASLYDDSPLYKQYTLGTTVWSPLASGVLTGKVR